MVKGLYFLTIYLRESRSDDADFLYFSTTHRVFEQKGLGCTGIKKVAA